MSEFWIDSTLQFTEFAAETMVYFEKHKLIEISKKILLECSFNQPEDPERWIALNIKRIAAEIYNACLNGDKYNIVGNLKLNANFLYRVVMFGRRASGRRTQALNLIKKFNLVYLDAEQLIYRYLRGDDDHPDDPLARELQRAFFYNNVEAKCRAISEIIAHRVLQKDTLTNGWVLVNYPHTLDDFKQMMESWKVPPNKIVYLHCSEVMCMKRLGAMPMHVAPADNFVYYEQEMRHFNSQQADIDKYLKARHETVHLDGEICSARVKEKMFALLQQTPYLIGARQDTYD